MGEVDTQLGNKIQNCLEQVLLMVSALVITCILLPELLPFLVPILFVYRQLMQYYRATNRDIKRLESVSRSPLCTSTSFFPSQERSDLKLLHRCPLL